MHLHDIPKCVMPKFADDLVALVSTLALINEVTLRRTQLVLRWVTMSGSIPGRGVYSMGGMTHVASLKFQGGGGKNCLKFCIM